eukprot:COSAG03_NODE_1216_length_4541_cov_2.260693_2_plen_343_part_00
MSNSLSDSEHQTALAIVGQDKIQEGLLEGKEEMEGMRNDFEGGEGGLKTGKGVYGLIAEGSKAVEQGTEYGASKLTEFTEGVARGASKAQAAGSALYSAGSKAVEGGKVLGQAVQEGVNYTGYLAGKVNSLGVVPAYKPLYPNAQASAGASVQGGLSEADQSSFLNESGAAMRGEAPPTGGAASRPNVAPAADSATADASGAADRLAQDTGDALKGIGSKLEFAGKAAGILGGVAAAGDDLIHGKIQGDNAWERTGNILTIAGTVADMIPGLEPIGLGLNVAAAAEAFYGKSQVEYVQGKQNDATHTTLTTDPAPVHSWSQQGLVASIAPDAIHQNVGSVHF